MKLAHPLGLALWATPPGTGAPGCGGLAELVPAWRKRPPSEMPAEELTLPEASYKATASYWKSSLALKLNVESP